MFGFGFILAFQYSVLARIPCLLTILKDSLYAFSSALMQTCHVIASLQSLLLALLDSRGVEDGEDSFDWQSEADLLWKVWFISSKASHFVCYEYLQSHLILSFHCTLISVETYLCIFHFVLEH